MPDDMSQWFRGLAQMKARKRAYIQAKIQPAVQEVLIDLATFCRANESTFHEDARKAAMLDGRREVWLRIQNHLHLTAEELMALYAGRGFTVTEEQK
jgi:hypothetical protein